MRQERNLDLLLLTSAAGMLDALSYLRAGAFTANMTGNTVLLGIALAGIKRRPILPSALALAGFAAGAAIAATLLTRFVHRPTFDTELRVGLLIEVPFLAGFAGLWISQPAAPHWAAVTLATLGASALGIQSVAVRRLRIAGVVTTFITGTITSAVMQSLSPSPPAPDSGGPHGGSPLLLAGSFASYLLSAALGALLYRVWNTPAPAIPLALACLVAARALIRRETPAPAPTRPGS